MTYIKFRHRGCLQGQDSKGFYEKTCADSDSGIGTAKQFRGTLGFLLGKREGNWTEEKIESDTK